MEKSFGQNLFECPTFLSEHLLIVTALSSKCLSAKNMTILLKFLVTSTNPLIFTMFSYDKTVSNVVFVFLGSHACLYDLLCLETSNETLENDFQTSSSGNNNT